jgi:uncharacterized protein YdeI (YjbR/CyaY-like superfamily)
MSSRPPDRVTPRPVFFATPEKFRAWLERNHATKSELIVGFYKKGSGKPSITWPEAVAEALCFGWIDGVRMSLDDERYTNRFTPRKPRSNWSAINVKLAEELIRTRRMRPAGRKVFEARQSSRTGIYSYEQRDKARLAAAHERRFKANTAAWKFFQAQAAWYRRTAVWWVISAKKEETRARRLDRLIADSAAGRRVPPLTSPTPLRDNRRSGV